MKNGFTGGLIVDYPNSTKAKKHFLFLMAGYSEEIMNEARSVIMPKAKTEDDSDSDDQMSEDDEYGDEEEKASWIDADRSDSEEEEQKVGVKGKLKKTKAIKRREERNEGRGKKNGKVHDRKWILKKKER